MIIQAASLATLYRISKDFVMVAAEGQLVAMHISSGDRLPRDNLITFCDKHYGKVTLQDPQGNLISKSSGAIWWDWDDASRRVVRRVVMEPTNAAEDPFSDVFNRWYVLKEEMAVPDASAQFEDIAPLIRHLMFISDGDEIGVFYFLCWLAELWRNPDIKIPTAIMLYSKNTRMGKSMLADLLAWVFGESMVKSIAGSKLYANFDDAMSGQRLIVLNELSRADKADRYETFKSLISEGKMEYEGKGRGSKYQRNCLHWIITTNNSDCLPLMQNDGRILVLRCDAERKDDAYYKEFYGWCEGVGPELLAGCFAKWKFPPTWDPKAPVPQTAATVQTQKEAQNNLVRFLEDLITLGKPPFDKDMGRCTTIIEQLNTLYPGNLKGIKLNNRTLPAALTDLRHSQFKVNFATRSGARVCTPVWCWRNLERWAKEQGQTIGDYLSEA